MNKTIQVVTMIGITPVKMHIIEPIDTNPTEIAKQLTSLRAFGDEHGKLGRDVVPSNENYRYVVFFADEVQSRYDEYVKLFKEQLPLVEIKIDKSYPYSDIPQVTYGSVWDFYKDVGYDEKTWTFVGVGNVK